MFKNNSIPRFIASRYAPEDQQNVYWVDLSEDVEGKVIKTYANGGWVLTPNLDAGQVTGQLADLQERVENMEALGSLLGSVATYADLPTTEAELKALFNIPAITANDIVIVNNDETHERLASRYIVTDVASDGTLTYVFAGTFSDNRPNPLPLQIVGGTVASYDGQELVKLALANEAPVDQHLYVRRATKDPVSGDPKGTWIPVLYTSNRWNAEQIYDVQPRLASAISKTGAPTNNSQIFATEYQLWTKAAELATAVANEAAARQTADTNIKASISAEASTRAAWDAYYSSQAAKALATAVSNLQAEIGTVSSLAAGALNTAITNLGKEISTVASDAAKALNNEANTRSEAASSLAAALVAEQTKRALDDSALSSALTAETSSRKATDSALWTAMAAEASVRAADVNELSSNSASRFAAFQKYAATETAARQTADASLAAAFTTALTAETAARQTVDASLAAALVAEVASRKATDAATTAILQNEIEERATQGAALWIGISTEGLSRLAGDNAIWTAVASVTAGLEAQTNNLDNKISAEASTRAAWDAYYSSQAAKALTTTDTNLKASISAEASTRAAWDAYYSSQAAKALTTVDTNLKSSISAEASTRAAWDAYYSSQAAAALEGAKASLGAEISTVASKAASALATAVANLEAEIDTLASDAAGALNTAVTNLGKEISTVASDSAVALGSVSASLEAEIGAVSSGAVGALDTAVASLKAEMATVASDAAVALASAVTGLEAEIDTVASDAAVALATATTNLEAEIDTIASNAASALATAVVDLEAEIATVASDAAVALGSTAAYLESEISTVSQNMVDSLSEAVTNLSATIEAEASIAASGLATLTARVEQMESLGHVLGSVDTKADLPTTVTDAKALWDIDVITTNDFAIVITDETQNGASSRYEAIVTGDDISWVHAGNYSAAIPTSMANPYGLTMTVEGTDYSYDGAAAVSVTVPPIMSTLEDYIKLGGTQTLTDYKTLVVPLNKSFNFNIDTNSSENGSKVLSFGSLFIAASVRQGGIVQQSLNLGYSNSMTIVYSNATGNTITFNTEPELSYLIRKSTMPTSPNDKLFATESQVLDAISKSTKAPNEKLSITADGITYEYDGSGATSVTIAPNPTKLPNPQALTLTIDGSDEVYDGSGAVNATIPAGFSGDYGDLSNKPSLFSGSYGDLTDKPTLFDGAYSSLSGLPTLFSGSWNDLTDKPDLSNYLLLTAGTQAFEDYKALELPTWLMFILNEETSQNIDGGAVTFKTSEDVEVLRVGRSGVWFPIDPSVAEKATLPTNPRADYFATEAQVGNALGGVFKLTSSDRQELGPNALNVNALFYIDLKDGAEIILSDYYGDPITTITNNSTVFHGIVELDKHLSVPAKATMPANASDSTYATEAQVEAAVAAVPTVDTSDFVSYFDVPVNTNATYKAIVPLKSNVNRNLYVILDDDSENEDSGFYIYSNSAGINNTTGNLKSAFSVINDAGTWTSSIFWNTISCLGNKNSGITSIVFSKHPDVPSKSTLPPTPSDNRYATEKQVANAVVGENTTWGQVYTTGRTFDDKVVWKCTAKSYVGEIWVGDVKWVNLKNLDTNVGEVLSLRAWAYCVDDEYNNQPLTVGGGLLIGGGVSDYQGASIHLTPFIDRRDINCRLRVDEEAGMYNKYWTVYVDAEWIY